MKITDIVLKQNIKPVTDSRTQVSAEEFNTIVTSIVDLTNSVNSIDRISDNEIDKIINRK
jgi:hypothetical protein